MLSLTRKTDYALVALSYLGERRLGGEPPVSARKIADLYHLPLPLLMNILKELTHARLVISTRGQQGGYALAADPGQITLVDIVTATEGPVRLAICTDGLPIMGQGCQLESGCPVRAPVRRLHERLNDWLGQVTLADLLEPRPAGAAVKREE